MPKKPVRILIVDDEKDLRELLASALTAHGYQILTADGALNAMSILSKESVDLIISDVRMPQGSARDLLNWVNRALAAQRPKVILMSGHSEVIEYLACQLGVDVFLVKPIELDVFLKAIDHTLTPYVLAKAN